MNERENSDIQQPARKRERGRAFIIFGTIFALLSIALFVLAPTIVPSTIDANKGATGGGLGGAVMRGFALEWARGIAEAMVMAGIFFCVIGIIMIATGAVREYRRRKITATA